MFQTRGQIQETKFSFCQFSKQLTCVVCFPPERKGIFRFNNRRDIAGKIWDWSLHFISATTYMLNWTTGHWRDSRKGCPDNISSDHSYVRGRDDMSTAARWASGPGCALSGPGDLCTPRTCRTAAWSLPTVCWGHGYCMTCTLISGRLPYKGLLGAGNQLPIQGAITPIAALCKSPAPSLYLLQGIKREPVSPGPYRNDLLVPLLISRCPIFEKPYSALFLILAR